MRSDALHQMGLRNSSTRSFDYVGFQRRWHPLHMLPARFDPKDKKKQGPKALGDQKCFLKKQGERLKSTSARLQRQHLAPSKDGIFVYQNSCREENNKLHVCF